MFTAADVFKRARFHLNDTTNIYYTDAVLLDPLNIALDDLRGELAENNVSVTNTTTSPVIVVNAGVSQISNSSTPPLPTGLIEIQDIRERTFGSQDTFLPITKMEFLPYGLTPTASLMYWSWIGQSVLFIPSTSDREIIINYIKEVLPAAVSAASNIDLIRGLPFLAYRSAALAAENLGEDVERAAQLNNNAGRELDKLINLSVKGKQVMPVRRKPFVSGAYSGR